MTLVEISEREVLAAAKALLERFRANPYGAPDKAFREAEKELLKSTALLEERERVAAEIAQGVIPPENLIFSEEPIVGEVSPAGVTVYAHDPSKETVYTVGADDNDERVADIASTGRLVARQPRKLSRREQEIERRRRSDPMGSERPEIDYGDDSLPTAR